jgi:hypothetical protein
VITTYLAQLSGVDDLFVLLGLLSAGVGTFGLTLWFLDGLLRLPPQRAMTPPPAPDRGQRPPPVITMPRLHGVCRWCGQLEALLSDGRLCLHDGPLTPECDGSYTEPATIEGVSS